MKSSLLVLVALAAASSVDAQIERPLLGFVLDSGGAMRPVTGEASSALLGDPAGGLGAAAISFACSAKVCLFKTDAAVIASTGENAAAPPGPAVIALDDFPSPRGVPGAWVYFPSARRMTRWHDGALVAAPFVADGRILSLRSTPDGFDYAVAKERTTWIEHYSASDGSVEVVDSVGAARSVVLLNGGVLVTTQKNVVLRRPDGGETLFALEGSKALYAAGSGYVEIATPGGSWILATDPGRERLLLLPGVAASGAGP